MPKLASDRNFTVNTRNGQITLKQAKLLHTTKLLGLLLLIGTLSCGYKAYAAHSRIAERGVIQTVDYTSKSLTIRGREKGMETFFWNSATWFRQKSPKPGASWFSRTFSPGVKATADSLQARRTVWIYYRREFGRSVAREIVVVLPAASAGS